MFKLVLEKAEEPEVKLPTSAGSSKKIMASCPNKVYIVKALVFPVVIYGYESWTIRKAECRRIDAFWTVLLEKTLESPFDCKKIQPVHPKGNQYWIFPGRLDQIANISSFIEKAREFQKNIYFCFIDYAKWFNYMDHNKLWKILKKIGIGDNLSCLLRNLYACQEATVRTGHGTTHWFQIGKGVRQGCILSPCLFKLYTEYIMRND